MLDVSGVVVVVVAVCLHDGFVIYVDAVVVRIDCYCYLCGIRIHFVVGVVCYVTGGVRDVAVASVYVIVRRFAGMIAYIVCDVCIVDCNAVHIMVLCVQCIYVISRVLMLVVLFLVGLFCCSCCCC